MRPRLPLLLLVVAALPGGCAVDSPPHRIDCDPGRTACAAETEFGRVVLDLSPRPVKAMSPMQIRIEAGGAIDEVRLELLGRDMDMGPNVARLSPVAKHSWAGTATIPVCITGRMRWDAVLVLRHGARTVRLAFGFEAG